MFDNFPMMMQATLEGHGIALGWHRTTELLMASGQIVRPFEETLELNDSLSVYKPNSQPMKKDTIVLLNWLKQELSQ